MATGVPAQTSQPTFDPVGLLEHLERIREPLRVVRADGRLGVMPADGSALPPGAELAALLPVVYPEWLGDRGFCEAHRVRFPYCVGEMANELTTTRMVVAAARAGFLGFFGAAGLRPERLDAALAEIEQELGSGPSAPSWGSNLIHSPDEPALEDAVVDVYLRHEVRRVSASAFMSVTPAVVRYCATGLSRDARGRIRRKNRLFAKVSRPETARLFLSPAPREVLDALVSSKRLTAAEAELAAQLPLAEDVTVEADSGGHTDNRPLSAIFPAVALVRDELAAKHRYPRPVRLGAAGGLGTPSAVAAAFALGASYVMTGSVNQAAVESGLGEGAKKLLAQAGIADVAMAPAADMFELGVKVQVLKRGTMFAPRADKLYALYQKYASLEELPEAERKRLETEVLRLPLDEVWKQTAAFWLEREKAQLERAEQDPHHKMALVFRWYLGQASRWAIRDEEPRRSDFQIWTGPALGAFNDWVRGTFLEDLARRDVAQIGLNLLEGAAVVTRAQALRAAGVPVGPAAFAFRPRPLS